MKYNLFDMFKGEKEQERKSKEERMMQNEKNKMRRIPQIALIVANLLVVSLDYRVVEAVYKMTKNPALALFAIFVTGAMFLLWFDVLYQYKLAREGQSNIALAASGLALFAAGYFAFLDYGVSVQISSGKNVTMPTDANTLFAWMVILTVINAALLFYWYMIDDQISNARNVAKEIAKRTQKEKTMEDVSTMLEGAEKLLTRKMDLVRKFGAAEVEIMLANMAGIEIDLNNDGAIGNVDAPIPAAAPFVKHNADVDANFTKPSTATNKK